MKYGESGREGGFMNSTSSITVRESLFRERESESLEIVEKFSDVFSSPSQLLFQLKK